LGLQRVRIHNTTPRDSGYDRIRSHEGAIHIPSLRSEPMTANKQQVLKGCLSTACLEINLCADHHAFSESWSLARPQCRDRACCSRLTKTVGGRKPVMPPACRWTRNLPPAPASSQSGNKL